MPKKIESQLDSDEMAKPSNDGASQEYSPEVQDYIKKIHERVANEMAVSKNPEKTFAEIAKE